MSDLDLDAIDERWNAATENVGSLAAQYDSAQDIPALLAEVGRLAQRLGEVERERDEARDLVDHWCPLAVERGQELDAALAEARRLRQELDEARAERDRLRPVVEAADALMDFVGGLTAPLPPGTMARLGTLAFALDATRSSTPDAEPAPGVPVDIEEQS